MSEHGPHDEPTRAGNPWGAPPPGPGGPAGPPPPPYQPYGMGGPGYPPPPGPPFQPRKSRLPLVLGVVAAVLVLGAAVTVPLVLAGDDDEPSSGATDRPTDDDTDDDTDGPAPTDLSEVREYADLPTTHVEEPVTYDQLPPVGGEHFSTWVECGVYDEPLPDENAVHDLEHGTFWFTYDADALSAEDVDALAAQLPDNGIMSPYDGLESPVVVTVWERQLALTGADDPRLALFLDEYAGGQTAPEPNASCAGGATPDELTGLDGA